MSEYNWNLLSGTKIEDLSKLLDIVLKNREIDDVEAFLNPTHPSKLLDENPEFKENFEKAKKIILKVIKDGKPIVIHGDYDVDGQTATAILWRTLYNDLNYKNVFPYIPNRFDEGYGVSFESLAGIRKMLKDRGFKDDSTALLITVDCGIVSNKEIDFAKENNFEVILTDHHQPSGEIPNADAAVWTDKATGAGISWLLANLLLKDIASENNKYLDLAAMGTICDLQPLVGINRSIAQYGIEKLNNSDLAFINAIKDSAQLTKIDTYEIGWVIGPRLNATGRLESAMDSLRLLCTDSTDQARELAKSLNDVNKSRQDQTQANLLNAIEEFKDVEPTDIPNFIVTSHQTYHEGVIGLVAGKLVQTYYRPAIAISIDKENGKAKGSARSIKGISIIETLRKFEELFINVGGHEMAAGFSIEETKIETLKTKLSEITFENPESTFTRQLDLDCEISEDLANFDTIDEIQRLKPFGVGNPEPTLLIKDLEVFNINIFGKENSHVKLFLNLKNGATLTALAFGRRDLAEKYKNGDKIDVAGVLSRNVWNGRTSLELKLKDAKQSQTE